MPPDASDVLALNDRIRACEKRREEFLSALNILSKHHITERFPGLSELLLSQAEIASDEQVSALNDFVQHRTNTRQTPDIISQELAAQLLGISAKTLSRIEHDPRKMREIGYPGRNVELKVFRDWSAPIRTSRMLRKAARDRTKAGHF